MNVEVIKPRAGRKHPPLHSVTNEPLRLLIDGHLYAVTTLNEDRSAVVAYDKAVKPGQVLHTTMVTTLDGFDLSVPAVWEVTGEVPSPNAVMLRLADANSPARLATLDTIIHAIVGNNLLSADEAVDLSRRDREGNRADASPTSPADDESHVDRPIRRRAGAIAFVLLALILLSFIGANFATRAWVVHADGAITNSQSVLARASEPAELVSFLAPVGTRVTRNTPLALLKSTSGQVLTLVSPCDCVVGSELAAGRSAVRAGQPIVQLVPAGGANKAILSIRMEDLRKVRVGDQVTATFYDSDTKFRGTVDRVSPPKILSGQPSRPANLGGTLEVRFDSRLPAWRVGEPIAARIVLSKSNPFA